MASQVTSGKVIVKWMPSVRLYTRVTETPVKQEIRLREEHVRVEHHPADRPATEADLATITEGTIEVTMTAPERVVSRHARVVKEVVDSKDVEECTETVRDTGRRTEVDVEPVETAPAQEARHKAWTVRSPSAGRA